MPRYMAIYTGSPEALARGADRQSPENEAAGMAAWGKWAEKNAGAIVDNGSPLGVTKRITSDGIADTHNRIAAYVVVEAPSHDAAARIFVNHPHFTIFPGDGVELMECLPMPRE